MIQKTGNTGQTLNGRYQIESHISQGGMATVYRATDLNLNRVVAVKIIHPHLSQDAEFVRRFEKEAKSIAQLRHPNIIQIFDYNHEESTYYIVLELVIGETLQARLQRLHNDNRTLALEETIAIAADMGDALEYAHSQGVIHRDVKPSNVLLNVQGEAILTDFGIAKMLGETQHTATGAVLGTARYMSPEQIKGRRIDGRTDVYSLGVMLFEMVGGRLPFESNSVMTMMMMHVNDPVPDLRQIRPDVSPALIAIINRALAKDPDVRYQSAAEMATALRHMDTTAGHTGATTILDDSSAFVLEPLYMQLQAAVAISNWSQALALGEQIQATEANYKDVSKLMSLARGKLSTAHRQPITPTEVLDSAPRRTVSKGIWVGGGIALLLLILGLIFGQRLFSSGTPPVETVEVIVEATATVIPGAAEVVAVLATVTDTPTIEPATNTPTPLPTEKPTAVLTNTSRPTNTPRPLPTATPTPPLPGRQTIPLAQLTPEIPWLAYDASQEPGTYYYGFNLNKAPFNDVLVRQAFALAVDRELVIANLDDSADKTPATVFTPPDILGRDINGVVGLPFDPDRARALLAEAGYPNGEGIPEIVLGFNERENHWQIAEQIVEMWQETLNITVTLQPYSDWGAYLELLTTDAPQIFRLGWVADYNDPQNFLDEFLSSNDGSVRTSFSNSDYDRIVTYAGSSIVSVPEMRQEAYIEAERILVEEEAVIIPIYHMHYNNEG